MERRSFPFLILSLLVFSGCRGNKGESDAASFRDGPARVLDAWATESPPPSPESGWQKANPGDRDREGDYVGKVLIAAFDGNFAKLDQMIRDAREHELRLSDGSWAADSFFGAFHDYQHWNRRDPEAWYGKLFVKLEEWHTARPESIDPLIALAALHTDYAWHARGGDIARNVSEDSWTQFYERLKNGAEIFQRAPEALERDPFANKVKLRLACAMNLDAEIIEAIFRSGQRAAPEYWHLYHQYAYFLLPRWYGSRHSEWSEWLATALADSSLPKIDQDRIYAQVVLRQLSFAYNDPHEPRVNVTGVDWERVREGTSRLMADFPLSTRIPNALLRGAVAHADFEGIEQALRWMNGYYDAGHWSGQNDLEFFNLVDRLKTIAPHLAEALRLD